MKRIIYIALGTMFLMITACTREEKSTQDDIYGETEFYAKYESPRGTKTAIQDNGDIYWSKGDKIDIFNGDNRSVFTSTNTTDAAETTFKGSLEGFSWEKTDEFWAVYPASEENTFGGDKVSLVVNDQQSGYFSEANFPSIAKTSDFDLTFYNICGGIRFKLTEEGIKKVTFRGKNQEPIAGLVTVQFDNDGKPVVSKIEDAKTEITLETGNIYSPGTWWYIVCLPTVLQNGYELILEKESGESAVKESSNTIEIKRSVWGELTKFDGLFPDAVDLGLSVKWAASNLGAIDETDNGNYYAWAETAPKDSYDDASYKWWDSMISMISKYVIKDNYFNSYYGPLDYRYVIEAEDDAASVKYGGDWRMPTKAEIQELINNCSWEWQDNYNGVSGYVVTSKVEGYTDKSIFLPLTGFKWHSEVEATQNYGIYWASNIIEGDPLESWGMIIYNPSYSSSYNKGKVDTWGGVRSQGAVIRPVYGKRIEVTSLAMNKTSLEIGKGQKATLNVTLTPSNAPNFGIIWKSTNESVVTVTDNSRIDSSSHYISAEITAVGFGEATIIAESVDTGVQAVCSVVVGEPQPVDLGLSVKWSTINIGAATNKESGNTTYKSADYDLAQFELGGKWRLPTSSEASELVSSDNCNWTWVKNSNIDMGYEVVSKNSGESIFLPPFIGTSYSYSNPSAYYLTSTKDGSKSYTIYFTNSSYKVASYSNSIECMIRPVYDESIIPITDIHINPSHTDVELGKTVTMSASIIPDNATYRSSLPVKWTSSNTDVATVDENGVVTTVSIGSATITAETCAGISSSAMITVTYPIPEIIDLGLSVKWASVNLGAVNNYDLGYRYAWGETSPKDSYSWSNYRWCNGSDKSITKYYCYYYNDYWGGEGDPDMKDVLDAEDDAVTSNLGTGWRMPTINELKELEQNCTWTQFTINSVKGFKITSNIEGYTDAWIFIPGGEYWSSTLYYGSYSQKAHYLNAWASGNSHDTYSTRDRDYGYTIRPVYDL